MSADEEARLWNQRFPVGTTVLVKETSVKTVTRTAAKACYGEAVVWLRGDPVAHLLSELEPVPNPPGSSSA